ncbi:MAG: ketoacyl-ACP synthase III [Rhodothermaceae bacterium]|nr:ketoacyl-ACP synthase III [Rhodothermaceae bacterium]
MTRNSCIIASGSYVPERIIPNSWFNEQLGEDVDTWLQENLTIRERRWMTKDQNVSDLCIEAANRALDMAGLKAADINLLIISTDTPDFISPSTASVVQYKTGMINAASFDLNTACAGFVTAAETATKYIQSDSDYKYVMVIGAYGMSRFLNLKDKKTATLFADGAGAAILTATNLPNKGHLASDLRTRGEYYDFMGIYGGAASHPASAYGFNEEDYRLQFVKKFPKELNPIMWTDMISNVARKGEFEISEIKRAFMTQININQIRETMDNLHLPHETAPAIMAEYGYTGSAAIGMALDISLRAGDLNPGDIFILMGSGGGLTFACNAFRM